jgi:hypothetical protein
MSYENFCESNILDLLNARNVSSICFYLLERDVDVIRHDGFKNYLILCIHMWAINSKGVKFTKQLDCIIPLLSHNNKHLETFNFVWFCDDCVIVYCIHSSTIKHMKDEKCIWLGYIEIHQPFIKYIYIYIM